MPRHPDDTQYSHLRFAREDISPERRKKPGFPGPRPDRGGRTAFAAQLNEATSKLLEEQKRKPQILGIKPHLVFRVPLVQNANAKEVGSLLEKSGFAIVSVEPKQAVIAFKDDDDLSKFRSAIHTYERGPKQGINPKTELPYTSTPSDVLEYIEPEKMRLWGRSDRIGRKLAQVIGDEAKGIDVGKSYTLDIELWHPGTPESAQTLLNELRQLLRTAPLNSSRLLDSFVGNTLLLAKVSVAGTLLSQLLNLDGVAEVDLPPVAHFDPVTAARVTAKQFPTPPRPSKDGPRLCILDSGITSNHPLLAANVGHEEAILTKQSIVADQHGHGTMVGGIAVFGDVRACYEDGGFSSPITLFSARVLNDQNQFDDEKLIINQMQQAIETFKKSPYDCRVFNLSLGGGEPILGNGKDRQTEWAEALDTIAREAKVLLIVSAGNCLERMTRDQEEAEIELTQYPKQLLDPIAKLCDPATSAIAITVGSLAQYGETALERGVRANDISQPVAASNQPSLITRSGPGLNGAIKPEFVHYGGNVVFQGFAGRRLIGIEPGSAVMSFSHQPEQRLFGYDAGTSFAAPRVAHLAALVHYRLREQLKEDPHPNLVRAVIANAASIPPEAALLLDQAFDQHAKIKVCGYGLPDDDFALYSWDRRVTLIAQGQIKLDHFHLFGIPLPDAFRNASGQRTISIALAFDPPVRRRFDYLGVEMDMFLIRGKTLDEVHDAFRKVAPDEDATNAIGSPYRIDLQPKATSRQGGYSRKKSTLQRGVITMKRPDQKDYGDTYWLVLRAERKWAPLTIDFQDYAVAITLTADEPKLYNQVRQRVQQRVRIRR